MTSLKSEPESILAIDVGTIHTRAMLFALVGERYRLVGNVSSRTTANSPFNNIGVGIQVTLEALQSTTGHVLLDAQRELIQPKRRDGSGVGACTATVSAGGPIKTVVFGLLEDASLESARRLASSTYSGNVKQYGHDDQGKVEDMIDELLRFRPDLVIVAGGTDNGASGSVLKLLEPLRMVCSMLPVEQQPEILYVGNQALHSRVQSLFSQAVNLHFASNIRPTLDEEQLGPAMVKLNQLTNLIRARQLPGFGELETWTNGNLLPTAAAVGRIVRFLSKLPAAKKGVLAVDVGSSATSLISAFQGDLMLSVFPQFGLGENLIRIADPAFIKRINHWLTIDLPSDSLREYLYNRAIYPETIPVTQEDLAIEGALARLALQNAIKQAVGRFQSGVSDSHLDLLSGVEPVLASGSALSRHPNVAESGLILLDGIQPRGTTTMILDMDHLTPALGVIGGLNPLIAVQVLDSNAFMHLGTVISPVGNAPTGTPILHIKMAYEDGREIDLDVNQGELAALPLQTGEYARIQLQPYHRYDIGMGGAGRGGGIKAVGGALGVVIDARGRPLKPMEDLDQRLESYRKWLAIMGSGMTC